MFVDNWYLTNKHKYLRIDYRIYYIEHETCACVYKDFTSFLEVKDLLNELTRFIHHLDYAQETIITRLEWCNERLTNW